MQRHELPYGRLLFAVIAAVTLYRYFVLSVADNVIDLYADEAYYWGWAQHLEWGYYSKPPMVAWLIALGTKLFGDTFMGIKIMALALYPLTTAVIYFLAKTLFDDRRIAFYSAVSFLTLPAVWLSSLIVSTDVPFLFFWALAMLFFIRAIRYDRWIDWLLAGLAGGGGLMSKYTMIVFVVSALAYLATSINYRHHLKNPKLYAAMAVAALVFAPNLWWNYQHDFVSFKHVSHDNAKIRGIHFHLDKMGEFLLSQFAVFGPVTFGWLLAILFRRREIAAREEWRLLWWFIVPMFGLILGVSLLSRAFANWSAPMYVASTVLVAGWLLLHGRVWWLRIAVVVNILMGIGLYHWHQIAHITGIELTRSDPYKRVMGWERLGKEVTRLLKRYKGAILLSDDRKELAELIYYVRPHPFNAQIWNPDRSKKNQYELLERMNALKGRDFLFVTEREKIDSVADYFKSARRVAVIRIPLYKDYAMVYYVYYLKHFKGY